jgi:hypothetical protein
VLQNFVCHGHDKRMQMCTHLAAYAYIWWQSSVIQSRSYHATQQLFHSKS